MDLTKSIIREKIRKALDQSAHSEAGKILNDTLIFKEGFFDSMGFLTLITFLEEEYQIKFSDDDFIEENFESLNAISDFVFKKIAT